MTLDRAGGIAAWSQALAYLVGFVILATALNAGDTAAWTPGQKLEYVLAHHVLYQVWMLFIYVCFGIALVVLVIALEARLRAAAPVMSRMATAFGLIWAGLVIASGMVATVGLETVSELHLRDVAMATSAWVAIGAIQNGLGGGVEVIGGLWLILVSRATGRAGLLPKAINFVGWVAGTAGLCTLVPALEDMGALFGAGQIVWFAGVGTVLLKAGHASRTTVDREPR